jgi:hypothetical protein
MKRIWWSSVILFLCLMYFTTAGVGEAAQANFLEDEVTFGSLSGNYGVGEAAQVNALELNPFPLTTQHRGGHIHLRSTATMPEALTLYEQARANLVAQ